MPGGQGKGNSTKKSRSSRFLIPLVVVCAVLATGISASIIYFRSAPSTQSIRTTRPVPPTQISCPKEGTARAAVTAPLVLGSHQNVVYIVNQPENAGTNASELLRYDMITRQTTTIVKSTHRFFTDARVTADGQWIIFIASYYIGAHVQHEIQMVRMDGQGLQTLYCLSGDSPPYLFDAFSLFPNGRLLAIEGGAPENEYIYLIDLTSGILQTDEMMPQSYSNYYAIGKWFDSTHLYMYGYAQSPKLYLLDTAKGPYQRLSDLQLVVDLSDTQCWDYDPSNSKTLFVVHCQSSTDTNNSLSTFNGPSVITVQNPLGGPPKVVYNNPTLAISQVRVANSTTLLFNVVRSTDGDTSQEGLWEIQTDGSHLTHLMNNHIFLGDSCASSDGRFYALNIVHEGTNGYPTYTPMVGSLNGSAPMPLPFSQDDYDLTIAGWTTM